MKTSPIRVIRVIAKSEDESDLNLTSHRNKQSENGANESDSYEYQTRDSSDLCENSSVLAGSCLHILERFESAQTDVDTAPVWQTGVWWLNVECSLKV